MARRGVVLALTGDVMTGRGIDQVLPAPGDPRLWEAYVDDAGAYVALAEAASGPVPRPVDPPWPWGDALPVLNDRADVRIINLETSVTTSDDHARGKSVCYRMHPGNVDCLTAAEPDVCTLANNHVLDFGVAGLEETLATLAGAGLRTAGAGRDADEAWRPAVVETDRLRILVWSVGSPTSGVPSSWAAGWDTAGVALLPDLSVATADELVRRIRAVRRPEDLVVVSIHWGANWVDRVPRSQVRFARRLVDGGVDVVHGHSAHHPLPIEFRRDGLVLHGCGDFIDDYEGIAGHGELRPELRVLHLVEVDPATRRVEQVELVPFRARRLRLERADEADTAWLQERLGSISRRCGTRVAASGRGTLLAARG